jgi:excisionase family DNA binding protein
MEVLQIQSIKAADLLSELADIKGALSEVQSKIESPAPLELIERPAAAKLLNVTFPTLHQWVRKGVIPAYKIGNRVYFKRSDIEKALQPISPRK